MFPGSSSLDTLGKPGTNTAKRWLTTLLLAFLGALLGLLFLAEAPATAQSSDAVTKTSVAGDDGCSIPEDILEVFPDLAIDPNGNCPTSASDAGAAAGLAANEDITLPESETPLSQSDIEARLADKDIQALEEMMATRAQQPLTSHVCSGFSWNASNPTELNDAISCFNGATVAGDYTINITDNINMATFTNSIGNSTPDVTLTVNGNLHTLNGNANGSVIGINDGDVTIDALTVTGGDAFFGGGIFNTGTLTVSNSNFAGNTAFIGGGVFSNGTLTLSNSTITGNTAYWWGGGIFASDLFLGSADLVTTTISNSTISGNSAGEEGGGIFVFASNSTTTISHSMIIGNTADIYDSGGIVLCCSSGNNTMTISHSTISENVAPFAGLVNIGGVVTVSSSTIADNDGEAGSGGIYSSGPMLLLDSTVSGNNGDFGGGILNFSALSVVNTTISGNSADISGGGIYNSGDLRLVFSTVTDNHAPEGAGISSHGSDDSTSTGVAASIVASNHDGGDVDLVFGEVNTFVSGGFNVIGDGNGVDSFDEERDETGESADLGPLADNGGYTLTHVPDDDSQAVDNVRSRIITLFPDGTDQRGVSRPQGRYLDAGAVEFSKTPLVRIDAPVDDSTVPGSWVTISGIAHSDDRSIDRAKVMLQNTGTGQFWTGTAWTSTWSWFNPVLSPKDNTRSWSYVASLDPGSYSTIAWAWDTRNKISALDAALFTVVADNTPPGVSVSSPFDGSTAIGVSQSITGTALDDIGVDRVKLMVKNATTNQFWNGTAWTSAWSWFDPGGTNYWSYPLTLNPGSYRAITWAWDTSNNISSLDASAFKVVADITPPAVTIASPPDSSALVGPGVNLLGGATDDVAVDRVKLMVKNTGTNQYWNGTQWTSAWSWFDPAPTQFGNTADWFYSLSLDPGSYQHAAWAWDTTNNISPLDASSFTVVADVTPPTITIVAPADLGIIEGGQVLISGSATDDAAIDRVKLMIYNKDTGQFWNGTDWTSTWSWIDPGVSSFGSWSERIPLEVGNYRTAAWAWDTTNNISTAAFNDFTVIADVTPPTVSIDAPANNATINGPWVIITGTSSDNVFIDRVELELKNTTTNQYWNGTEWTSTESLFEPSGTFTWHYIIGLAPGIYQTTATAWDTTNNPSPTTTNNFTIN